MSSLKTCTRWRPKAGNADAEYEDAFCTSKRADKNGRVAFAIADGATETLLSRQWAHLLVKRFARAWQRPEDWNAWLAQTLRAWDNEKRAYMQSRARNNKPIQWYEEPGLEAGAFAALLGIVVERTPRGLSWRAVALGDCCLVQVRAENVLCAFPISQADGFNNRPLLLSSHPAKNKNVADHLVFAQGAFQEGDRMYLMTDALAAWFLRAQEAGAQPWNELDAFLNFDAFAAWVTEKRAAHAMRNDDVTLMRLIWN